MAEASLRDLLLALKGAYLIITFASLSGSLRIGGGKINSLFQGLSCRIGYLFKMNLIQTVNGADIQAVTLIFAFLNLLDGECCDKGQGHIGS